LKNEPRGGLMAFMDVWSCLGSPLRVPLRQTYDSGNDALDAENAFELRE